MTNIPNSKNLFIASFDIIDLYTNVALIETSDRLSTDTDNRFEIHTDTDTYLLGPSNSQAPP